MRPHAADLAAEWKLQQIQYDRYELQSEHIKLGAILLLAAALLIGATNPWVLAVFGILWLQNAIWKTFQSRIEQRLLDLEAALNPANSAAGVVAFQFNTEFARRRGGTVALVRSYLKQAIRPTVALPHVLLIGCYLIYILFF